MIVVKNGNSWDAEKKCSLFTEKWISWCGVDGVIVAGASEVYPDGNSGGVGFLKKYILNWRLEMRGMVGYS